MHLHSATKVSTEFKRMVVGISSSIMKSVREYNWSPEVASSASSVKILLPSDR